MRRPAALTLILAAALPLPGGARASPPMIVEQRSYYGPGRLCSNHYALDVAEGEGWDASGALPQLFFPGGGIHFGWAEARSELQWSAQPMGRVRLPGGVRLDRVRFAFRNSAITEILYVYDTGEAAAARRLTISSTRFNGTAADLAVLRRIRFGNAARAMCANVPERLRTTPPRHDPEATWLEPRTHAGPLTLCRSDLALQILPGETIRLPWSPDEPFRLNGIAGGWDIEVQPRAPDRSSPGTAVPPLVVITGGPDLGDAIRARFRARRPSDRCFAPPPAAAAAPTSGL